MYSKEKRTRGEDESEEYERELDYKARKVAEWILFETNGKVTKDTIKNVKTYVNRSLLAIEKEEKKKAAEKSNRHIM